MEQQEYKTFRNNFGEYFKQSDADVLRFFSSIAKSLSNTKPIPASQVELKKTNLDLNQLVNVTHDIVAQVAPPILGSTIKSMHELGKITLNQAYEHDSLKYHEEQLRNAQARVQRMTQDGQDTWAEEILINHEQEVIADLKEKIDKGDVLFKPSQYSRADNTINVHTEDTVEDIRTLAHEGIHAIVESSCGLTDETAPIATEFEICKHVDKSGGGGSSTKHFMSDRFLSAQQVSSFTSTFADLYHEYQQTNKLSDKAIAQTILTINKRRQEYGITELTPGQVNFDPGKINYILSPVKYFVGTLSALVLTDTIKNQSDMQNMFSILNDKSLSVLQQFEKLGITKQNVANTANSFIKQSTQITNKLQKTKPVKASHILKQKSRLA